MTSRALMLLALLVGCSRRDVTATRDPEQPKKTPGPTPVVKAERILHAGHLVDVSTRKVVLEVAKKPPRFSALDDGAAYTVDDAGEVHAVDIETAKERFHTKPARCQHFAATEHELHCADGASVHAIDKATGALRTVAGTRDVAQMLGVGRHLVVVRAGGTMESIEERTGAISASISGPLHAFPPLIAHGGGLCGATSTSGSAVFAGCWSETLVPRWVRTASPAIPGDPPFTAFPRNLGHGFLVAGTESFGAKGVERAVVLRLFDGAEVARVGEELAAVGARDDTTLDGLVSIKRGFRYLEPNGTRRFLGALTRVDDAADAVIDGDRLFLAVYPSISVGCELRAFDRTTGGFLWTATPELPPIAHSAYMNRVHLSVRAGVLVVAGEEAAFDYVLLLDPATGTELLADVVKLW